jgi:glycosyltransferase involved in cell wall biosynthesis
MSNLKVLYICHNHATVRPGGVEAYALELYEAMRASDEFEPLLLAKGGPPVSVVENHHLGTPFGLVNDDPNQYFFYTNGTDFDHFYGTLRNKDIYTKFLHEFLISHQPNVVHIQHTVLLGYDLIRQIRTSLPHAVIVYTLHEFLPICHRQGQMVRTNGNELCSQESPRRCHECFPGIPPQHFFMRKRFVLSHLSLVDLFLTPSRFLLERYVEWGIPREKIRYEPNGRHYPESIVEAEPGRPRNRLGFFGQFSLYKGVNVLLRAMKSLTGDGSRGDATRLVERWTATPRPNAEDRPDSDSPNVQLRLHGANLELQPGTFQNEFRELLEATRQNVTLVGRYEQADLPRLMANVDWVVVPSIWWENSPLVIQEAFQHRRPVICSNIGGMAEKVAHGVNGLHFQVGDAVSLAETIRHAVSTPGLYEALRGGIPEVYKIEDHVTALADIYRSLLERAASTA